MTVYPNPGTEGSNVRYRERYDNYIGGDWVAPVDGEYFDNITPVTGEVFCQVARGKEADINLALDAAHKAAPAWGATSPQDRARVLLKIADRMEEHLEELAVAETWENGKAVRETLAADIPLAIDHFRYYAGALRAQEGRLSQIDEDMVAYHFNEPLGVVGQIIPWNFPLLMAAWKLAPALAAGNAIVLKPAEQTPASILYLMDLVGDLIPAGVLNVVNGMGAEAGAALSGSDRIAKIAFTGSTEVGKIINKAAADKIIPVTLELGGKSPALFFEDIFAKDDDFKQKAIEGFAMFALNQGEICTCPSRALVQESIADEFLELGVQRVKQIKTGNPLDTETMMGAQASAEQMNRIQEYLEIGPREGAEVLTGGGVNTIEGLENGMYIEPTVFKGTNDMRIFQEEIFGPVLSVTTFKDFDEAIRVANDTIYGLGAGVWARFRHHGVQGGPRHPGWSRVGEPVPHLPRARGVRRVQTIRYRPRDTPDDAGALPADQEPSRLLLRAGDGLVLSGCLSTNTLRLPRSRRVFWGFMLEKRKKLRAAGTSLEMCPLLPMSATDSRTSPPVL